MERINYRRINGYYFPILLVPEEERTIGRWGRMRLKHLKEHRPIIYSHLLLSGKLQEHLADLDEQVVARETLLIEQMKKAEGVTEELKARDQMEWVRRMNNICNRAEENIKSEMIYS